MPEHVYTVVRLHGIMDGVTIIKYRPAMRRTTSIASMRNFRIGIDSYSLSPLELSPFEVLDWVAERGGDGVQFTELHLDSGGTFDGGFLRDLAQRADTHGLYLEWAGGEHIPFDTVTWQRKDLTPINATVVKQAAAVGATIVRSCSGGLMRWRDDSPPTEVLLRETAAALKAQAPIFRDHGVVLAIELHFEFTTFELIRLFDMCGAEPGGWLGICLDTMNPLTMLEDPVSAVDRILPWVVAVHAKDGALRLHDRGLASFPVECGVGFVDFERIFRRLAQLDRTINLSLEDHGGSFDLPIFDASFLSRFPDLTVHELAKLLRFACLGERRLDAGELSITERSAWADFCEKRVERGLKALQNVVCRVTGVGPQAECSD